MKQIPDYPRYSLDKEGNLYGLKGQLMKGYLRGRGYLGFDIRVNGKRKILSIHRLMLHTFKGMSLDYDGRVVDHINGNKLDNRLNNLQLLENHQNVKKGLGLDFTLPKGVGEVKGKHWRFTIYDKDFPKGRILKTSIHKEVILDFAKKYYNE